MATLQPGEKARMYALGGIMRGGASRGGYVDSRIYVSFDGEHIGWAGDDPTRGVLLGTLTIADILDETPNTCTFRVNGYVPADGAEVILTRGSKNTLVRLFAGYALTVQQVYAGIPKNVQADVRAVDYTWLLGMQKVTGQYRGQSATAIVQDLVARFAGVNGFTTAHVAPGLPILDLITFTDEDLPTAITRVCRRIGAYWYVDYVKDVHVFFEDTSRVPPVALTPTHASLTHFSRLHERTQGLTRVYVEGRGSRLLAGVNPGETRLPLEAVDMFTAAPDVFLKVSFSGAEGALHLNFAAVSPSSTGSLVGPGSAPSSGPTLTAQAGGAIEPGIHGYASTWVTAAGESKPSPIASVTTGILPTPTQTPGLVYDLSPVDPQTSGSWKPGDMIEWAYSWTRSLNTFTPAMWTPLSLIHGPVTCIASPYTTGYGNPPGSCAQGFNVGVWHATDPAVAGILVWHRVNGGAWRVWLTPSIANQPGLGMQWVNGYNRPAQYSQAATPASTASAFQTVQVAGIATGPAMVTGRRLYRTRANQAPLFLVATLADNTATTYTDAAADATLGVAAPVEDTSGVPSPDGIVPAGATAVIVASIAPFAATGGWVLAGEQALRYSGVGVGALTGIPASGPGAVVGPIPYNTAIRAAPMLTGIPASGLRSLPIALNAGDEVYAVVQVDDAARQAQLAADLGVASGIREEWISDRRLSIPEARARGQATLLSRPLTEATVEYTCRDQKTASGLSIQVHLGPPTNVIAFFKIQQVVWSNFRARPEQPPTARVTASSRRFSFEDLLRIVKTKD